MELNSRPFFSIIIPVYKSETYLPVCIDSILNQDYDNFEAILVDDGSPDNSGVLCDEFAEKDPRVKVIHKENGGSVSARRAGLAASNGDYIVHVDSDDYIDQDLLKNAAKAINEHSADAFMFGYVKFSENEQTEHRHGIPADVYEGDSLNIFRQNLILGSNACVSVFGALWTMIIKRELLIPCAESVPEDIYRGEDQAAVFPALLKCEKVVVSSQCAYHYRTTPGSVMTTFRRDMIDQALKVAKHLSEQMGAEYQNRIDCYVLKELYYCLSEIVKFTYRDYKRIISSIMSEDLLIHLKRARFGKDTHITDKVLFFILKNRLFTLFRMIKLFKK